MCYKKYPYFLIIVPRQISAFKSLNKSESKIISFEIKNLIGELIYPPHPAFSFRFSWRRSALLLWKSFPDACRFPRDSNLTPSVAVLGFSAAGREIGGKPRQLAKGSRRKAGRDGLEPEPLQGDWDTPRLRLPALLLRPTFPDSQQ